MYIASNFVFNSLLQIAFFKLWLLNNKLVHELSKLYKCTIELFKGLSYLYAWVSYLGSLMNFSRCSLVPPRYLGYPDFLPSYVDFPSIYPSFPSTLLGYLNAPLIYLDALSSNQHYLTGLSSYPLYSVFLQNSPCHSTYLLSSPLTCAQLPNYVLSSITSRSLQHFMREVSHLFLLVLKSTILAKCQTL